MAITITHAKVSGAGPAADPSKVGGDDWDDDHVVTGGIQPATVTLSSADILDLHNTPITLVAAPGSGKYIEPHRIVGYYTHGTTEYVFTGGLMLVTFGSTSLGEFDATGNQDIITPLVPAIKIVASEQVNAALLLYVPDAITDGDGDLTINIWYSEESVPA